jgi:hypothetical protein
MPNESQEYDWQNKWYECFGQALYYGMKTGKANGFYHLNMIFLLEVFRAIYFQSFYFSVLVVISL